MTPDHGELLYEGKAKRVFASADPDRVLVEFKNDATAFNAQKKAQLENKGRLNCQISARLFGAGARGADPLLRSRQGDLDAGSSGGDHSSGSGSP